MIKRLKRYLDKKKLHLKPKEGKKIYLEESVGRIGRRGGNGRMRQQKKLKNIFIWVFYLEGISM